MKETIHNLFVMLSGFGSQKMEDVGFTTFFFIMFVSLVCSFFISRLYVQFYAHRSTGSQVHRSFPLLGISITAIFICIQFSLPLSLGLLGALSIVRFRTPIKEPEEIGFIMLVIACSISTATLNFAFLGILLIGAIAACMAVAYGPKIMNRTISEGVLIVTLPQSKHELIYDELINCLTKIFRKGKLESVTKNLDESVLTYSFTGLKDGHLGKLNSELNKIIGSADYNIYFNEIGDYGR